MKHDINPAESPVRLVPELPTPRVTRRRAPLTRLLDLLAVRPGLARVLSDGLLLLALCGGGLGAVAYYQHAAATRPAPLAGMAELHAQLIEVPATPAPTDGTAAVPDPEGTRAVPAPTAQVPGARTGSSSREPEARASVPAEAAEPAPPQEARPITGAAREVMQRLTRAAGLVVPETALSRPTATVDVARALTRAGKPVTARVLATLQTAPDDPDVIAEVTLRLRGFTPPPAPNSGSRPVQASGVGGGPEAVPSPSMSSSPVPSPAGRPSASAGGAAKETVPARGPATVGRAQPGKPSAAQSPQAQGPEALPGPPHLAASGKPAPGKALSATLDDPVPVNWLQTMTEQAVTPLTPRN